MQFRPIVLALQTLMALGIGVRAESLVIDQVGLQFSQIVVAVKPGDSIVFVNHDDVTHNIGVIDDEDETTDLGMQKPGQTITYTFDRAGRFKVRCSIHPGMRMTINAR